MAAVVVTFAEGRTLETGKVPIDDLLPEGGGTAIAPPKDILDAFRGPSALPKLGAWFREFNDAIDNGPNVVLRLLDMLLGGQIDNDGRAKY